MGKQTFNLGRVTAYADAVAGGYTGTREEFQAFLSGLEAPDTTLSKEGVAADAKAVGDAIKNEAVENKDTVLYSSLGDGALGAIVDIANTYFRVAYNPFDQLLYSSTHGLFTDVYDENGVKSIVCSQFTQACLCGIAYPNSRYVLGTDAKNIRYGWGWEQEEYMMASDQYLYFDGKGVLDKFYDRGNLPSNSECNTILAALQPGDLVFFRKSAFNSDVTEDDDGIEHAGFLLRTDPATGNYTLMHSANDTTRLADTADVGVMVERKSIYRSGWPIAARVPLAKIIPWNLENHSTLVTAKELDKSDSVTENTSVHTFTFDPPLPRGFYTVNLETEDDGTGYILYDYEKKTGLIASAKCVNGVTSIVFYAQMPVTKIEVVARKNTTYQFGTCYIYRGYHGYGND